MYIIYMIFWTNILTDKNAFLTNKNKHFCVCLSFNSQISQFSAHIIVTFMRPALK